MSESRLRTTISVSLSSITTSIGVYNSRGTYRELDEPTHLTAATANVSYTQEILFNYNITNTNKYPSQIVKLNNGTVNEVTGTKLYSFKIMLKCQKVGRYSRSESEKLRIYLPGWQRRRWVLISLDQSVPHRRPTHGQHSSRLQRAVRQRSDYERLVAAMLLDTYLR